MLQAQQPPHGCNATGLCHRPALQVGQPCWDYSVPPCGELPDILWCTHPVVVMLQHVSLQLLNFSTWLCFAAGGMLYSPQQTLCSSTSCSQ